MTDQIAGHPAGRHLDQRPDPLVRQLVAVVAILLTAAIAFALVTYVR